MGFESIILLPVAAGFGLLYWSSLIDEDKPVLKLMLQFMFFPCIFLAIQLSVIAANILYASNTDLVLVLANFAEYSGYLLYGVGAYYLFHVMYSLWMMFQTKKAEKDAETYDGG